MSVDKHDRKRVETVRAAAPGKRPRGIRLKRTLCVTGLPTSPGRTPPPDPTCSPSLIAAAVAAGLCAALLFASSGRAAPGRTETLRVFERTVSIQLTKADGTVRKKLPIAETEPQAGDVLDVVFNLFAGNHVKHSRKAVGTDHLRCAFVAAGPPSCVSHAAFGSSMLVVEGNPGTVVLGTGKYYGASGRVVSAKEVKAAPPSSLAHNDIDVVARINLK